MIAEMYAEWKSVDHRVKQFWTLPKLESGRAQVPYLYGIEQNTILNRNMELRRELCRALFIPDPEDDLDPVSAAEIAIIKSMVL